MDWWLWLILGMALMAVELAISSQFFLFCVGVAAIIVGGLDALSLLGPMWTEWVAFSVGSVLTTVLMRPWLSKHRGEAWSSHGEMDNFVGESAVPLTDIAPNGTGRAELRGSTWTAKNGTEETLAAGRRCVVERVDGLTIWIRPE